MPNIPPKKSNANYYKRQEKLRKEQDRVKAKNERERRRAARYIAILHNDTATVNAVNYRDRVAKSEEKLSYIDAALVTVFEQEMGREPTYEELCSLRARDEEYVKEIIRRKKDANTPLSSIKQLPDGWTAKEVEEYRKERGLIDDERVG